MNKINKKIIKQILDTNNLKPIKKFGQNFIYDQNIIEKIINISNVDKKTCVIEIGPGLGSLTTLLVNKAKHLIVYEIDKKITSILHKKFKDSKNIEIINDDFLKIDINGKLLKLNKKFSKIVFVSNLPYYITSQILLKVLKEIDYFDKCVFMMQKEVSQRLTAKPSSKKYNNFSILVQHYSIPKYEFDVSKDVFIPMPKVTSSVLSFIANKKRAKLENEDRFFKMLRSIFSQKRKTILNNLTRVVNSKIKANEILKKLDIEPRLRPENISYEKYIAIYKLIS